MKTIYKYEVKDKVELPKGANILSVQIKEDVIFLWAEVDTEVCFESRRFLIVGTGHRFPTGKLKYIGTVQQYGIYVWHIYEDLEESHET